MPGAGSHVLHVNMWALPWRLGICVLGVEQPKKALSSFVEYLQNNAALEITNFKKSSSSLFGDTRQPVRSFNFKNQ
jgi:hypothetical protein